MRNHDLAPLTPPPPLPASSTVEIPSQLSDHPCTYPSAHSKLMTKSDMRLKYECTPAPCAFDDSGTVFQASLCSGCAPVSWAGEDAPGEADASDELNCVLVHFFVLSGGHGFHGHAVRVPATQVHALPTQCKAVPLKPAKAAERVFASGACGHSFTALLSVPFRVFFSAC